MRDDPIQLSARQISVDTRVGWLLATTRLLHPDPTLRRCDTFCAMARERGLRIDRSRVSRWEGGTAAAGWEVIEMYETVLDRPPGSLATAADCLRRAFDDVPPRHPRPPDASPDGLLDAALGAGELTGAQWQELARSLTAYDSLYLRRDDWDTVTTRLVGELGRGTGAAYTRRFEAAARLIQHPAAQRHLSRALGRYVMDPDAQVVLPVLRLLTEVHDTAASTLVLRMVTGDHPTHLRQAAASVAAAKLRHGTFPEAGLSRLEAYVAATLRRAEALDQGLDALDVTVQLPLRSFQRVLHQVPDPWFRMLLARSRATGELVAPQHAAGFVAEVAAAVQADETELHRSQEPDLMLRRLLREALFHVHHPRRHHAALMLAASPYRSALSRRLQEEVDGPDSFLAARSWTALMRVGYSGPRSDLLRRATSEPRPDVRARALATVGLDDLVLSAGEARALVGSVSPTEPSSVRRAMFFALGMSGGALLAELSDHESEDYWRPARWWRAQGTAIHEAAS